MEREITMATKSYTDLQQSKKLAEFLPLESADMRYGYIAPYDYSDRMYDGGYDEIPYPKDFLIKNPNFSANEYDTELPCWSLVALLKLIPKRILRKDKIHCGQAFIPSFRWEITPTAIYYTDGNNIMDYVSFRYGENNIELIDAVFKMAVWLKEKGLL